MDAEGGELSLIAVIAIIIFFIWCAWQITLLGSESRSEAAAFQEPGQLSVPAENRGAFNGAHVVEARLIERIEPVYPRSCLAQAGSQEIVMVAFNVSASGRVVSERAASASNACFEAAALNAVRRWRFEPRTVDGARRAAYDQTARFSFDKPL